MLLALIQNKQENVLKILTRKCSIAAESHIRWHEYVSFKIKLFLVNISQLHLKI